MYSFTIIKFINSHNIFISSFNLSLILSLSTQNVTPPSTVLTRYRSYNSFSVGVFVNLLLIGSVFPFFYNFWTQWHKSMEPLQVSLVPYYLVTPIVVFTKSLDLPTRNLTEYLSFVNIPKKDQVSLR